MGEFERGHNSEVVERATDNAEIPQLMKCLPNLGINNKEKPLCFGYSVKARALLFAHLSRVPLPKLSLHQDRLYIVKKCPCLSPPRPEDFSPCPAPPRPVGKNLAPSIPDNLGPF